jgi:hypothetical protein
MEVLRRFAAFVALWSVAAAVRAQDMPGAVLELKFTPAPRAQIAIWLEHADGGFIRTLALTEAVAIRGIGNRPGASQMNSGYRWPYGRREGVLPIWAARRAAAPGAKPFRRVIFQDRYYEGLASRTADDQSVDDYYCLSFDRDTTRRDALDAVSCASVFMSDKGRFMTTADVTANYGEPWQDPETGQGSFVPLPLDSLYPPRIDITRCAHSGCHDHADVASYVDHAREVMPEIDAVSMATPPGWNEQSVLFSLPADWPTGQYAMWFEINVEGDYNATFDDASHATPVTPQNAWDSWAIDYGYPYRGQPSVAFAVPFELGEQGEVSYFAAAPEGRASWNVWSDGYGALEPMTGISDDPDGAPGSGADRLLLDASGRRVTLVVNTLTDLPEPDPDGDGDLPDLLGPGPSSNSKPEPEGGEAGSNAPEPSEGSGTEDGTGEDDEQARPPPERDDAVIIVAPGAALDGPVGAVRGLELGRHPDVSHAHEWITLRFIAASSEQPLHRYEIRISEQPITDAAGFVRGLQAKTASEDREGAVALRLPADVPAGVEIEGEVGNLVARTHYWVAVRAADRLNRAGPISVAQITTSERTFATVTPCFIATAAYGTPMAGEIRALRRARDRHLLTDPVGRTLVRAYYTYGERIAARLRTSAMLRALMRDALAPIAAAARLLEASE